MVVRLFSPHVMILAALSMAGSSCLPSADSANGVVEAQKSNAEKKKKEYHALAVPDNEVPSSDQGVSRLAVGKQHVCAIRSGYLYCWGLNSRGQIGSGKDQAGALPNDEKKFYTQPTPYLVFNDATVTDVAVGLEHTCALRAGKLYCWGSNEFGQVGKGDSRAFFPQPEALLPDETFSQIAVRGLFNCAVSTAGKLYCWGSRPVHKGAMLEPKIVSTVPRALDISAVIQKVSMSEYHACYLTTAGAVACWGLNASGEIGNGDEKGLDVNAPYEVFAAKATDIALSEGRSCAMVESDLKCWGSSIGDRKQDSDKNTDGWNVREPRPYDSVFFAKVSPIRKLSSRGTVLGEDGKLYYGSFLHFEGLPKVIAEGVVDFDYSEAEIVGCVMFKNRKVKCWGSNLFGQFGNGQSGSAGENQHWYQATDANF